jgi:hypothetical protein
MDAVAFATPEQLVACTRPLQEPYGAARALSAMALILLSFGTLIRVFERVAVAATKEFGLNERAVFAVGATEAVCLIQSLVPRTVGARRRALTRDFGGAIATRVRGQSTLITHTFVPHLCRRASVDWSVAPRWTPPADRAHGVRLSRTDAAEVGE